MATAEIDSSPADASFGELLRRHRLAQGLTQDALAERAGSVPTASRNWSTVPPDYIGRPPSG
jgi:helix-turn-helix protein